MTFSIGRTAERKTASHFCWPMLRLLLIALLGLTVAACGVKNDLVKPDGTATPKNTPDPSKPPYPIGR